jgi:hypothetical protein
MLYFILGFYLCIICFFFLFILLPVVIGSLGDVQFNRCHTTLMHASFIIAPSLMGLVPMFRVWCYGQVISIRLFTWDNHVDAENLPQLSTGPTDLLFR